MRIVQDKDPGQECAWPACGQWNEDCVLFLYCFSTEAVECRPPPAAPQNGQRNVSDTTFGSTVTYSCNTGYTLQGPRTRVCMANKQWNGSALACNRKLCTNVALYTSLSLLRQQLLVMKCYKIQ